MLGPHIVIAPLTTLGHWKREIQTWTDMVQLTHYCVCLTWSKALLGELSLCTALVFLYWPERGGYTLQSSVPFLHGL